MSFLFIHLVSWSKNVHKLLVWCCWEPPVAGINTSCFHMNHSSHTNLNSSRWYCPNPQPSMDEHLVGWYINRVILRLATFFLCWYHSIKFWKINTKASQKGSLKLNWLEGIITYFTSAFYVQREEPCVDGSHHSGWLKTLWDTYWLNWNGSRCLVSDLRPSARWFLFPNISPHSPPVLLTTQNIGQSERQTPS